MMHGSRLENDNTAVGQECPLDILRGPEVVFEPGGDLRDGQGLLVGEHRLIGDLRGYILAGIPSPARRTKAVVWRTIFR